MHIIFRLLLAFVLLISGVFALSAEETTTAATKGPPMGELLQLPKYIYAWQGMMAGETPPEWIKEYATTLDGPPTPTIPVPLDDEIYTLGFTCKPNDCENNQLFVLFAPEGRDAWALLASPAGFSWLGRPSDRVKDAINGSLRK